MESRGGEKRKESGRTRERERGSKQTGEVAQPTITAAAIAATAPFPDLKLLTDLKGCVIRY